MDPYRTWDFIANILNLLHVFNHPSVFLIAKWHSSLRGSRSCGSRKKQYVSLHQKVTGASCLPSNPLCAQGACYRRTLCSLQLCLTVYITLFTLFSASHQVASDDLNYKTFLNLYVRCNGGKKSTVRCIDYLTVIVWHFLFYTFFYTLTPTKNLYHTGEMKDARMEKYVSSTDEVVYLIKSDIKHNASIFTLL